MHISPAMRDKQSCYNFVWCTIVRNHKWSYLRGSVQWKRFITGIMWHCQTNKNRFLDYRVIHCHVFRHWQIWLYQFLLDYISHTLITNESFNNLVRLEITFFLERTFLTKKQLQGCELCFYMFSHFDFKESRYR